MFIINGLGGGGSTFVLRQLQLVNYHGNEKITHKRRGLEKTPWKIPFYNFAWGITGRYTPKLHVMMRPDSYWSDPSVAPRDLKLSDIKTPDLVKGQRDYLVDQAAKRSSGVTISKEKLSTNSLHDLADSYLTILRNHEKETGQQLVLLSGHWGSFGIYNDLDVPMTYLIRDPFNSVISHGKGIRHENLYLGRGLTSVDSIDWVNCYLNGPLIFWKSHAKAAATHKSANILRYNEFAQDWRNHLAELPDISNKFSYKESAVTDILSQNVRDYIFSEVGDYFAPLGIAECCEKYR